MYHNTYLVPLFSVSNEAAGKVSEEYTHIVSVFQYGKSVTYTLIKLFNVSEEITFFLKITEGEILVIVIAVV